MGGGAGASIHGRFRIATENTLFVMPETALGLFPDVGASYFLSRLPGFFGEYVGLTGARLDGAEMLACGLSTHYVPSKGLPVLEEALVKADSGDPAFVSTNNLISILISHVFDINGGLSIIIVFEGLAVTIAKKIKFSAHHSYSCTLCIISCTVRGKLHQAVLQATMASSTNGQTDHVLMEDKSSVRIITLNRPKQLNALSAAMVSRLLDIFLACAQDSSVKLIILKGKGRAFCAGADVAEIVRHINEDLSRKELTMNYLMATYSRPQVSILNGIVMGGGAGASIHGRFRIATENTLFAMPETALGLFPDVGASYFLSRLPGFFGEYVGLTGARLDGVEMLACGLATHFVSSERLLTLEEALVKADSSDPNVISSIISEFSMIPNLKKNSAYHRLDIINKCFSRRTVEEIITAVEREAADMTDDWISFTIHSLKRVSPMSLKISLRSIREGRLEGIGKCLFREFRMLSHAMRGDICKDFVEGCRAILLDKDKNPKWEPSKIESISDEMVDRYFSKIDDYEWEDLELTVRSNLPAYAIAKL
ncbi:3-hydroxyisobutyryl-coa hydrolase 1 [Phtheirospermum japonicum]|uniref:3-hydroxyisobutyryl-CoA hydrolase n=1 Tax=Phtheirospermum japonicum TaxID=374723 RepID=A0A830C6W9_9LAMI|nr:3-hydroxyisobutyryl-coa hydrolase 1 [Phtheirospermum japonicum]